MFSRTHVHTSCLMEALAGYGSDDDAPTVDPKPATDPAITRAVHLDLSLEIPGSKIAAPLDDKNTDTSATNFSFPAPPEDFDENESLVFTTVAKKQKIDSPVATHVPSFKPPVIGPAQHQKVQYQG